MKIAVVTPKMKSCERGGAENFYEGLVEALNRSGHDATQIELEIDESNFENILKSYCKFFYLDLSEYDLVISTKSPTYMVRHRNHISYLVHTIRVFYDMFDSSFIKNKKEAQKQKDLIHEFDKYGLHPCRIKKHYVIGETVSNRLKVADPFWNQIDFKVLYPAPFDFDFREPELGEFIFLPGRLHKWKRVDLLIRSMKYVTGNIKLIIAGDGEEAENLKSLVAKLKLDERIIFLGRIPEDKLLDLYSKSIVVPFVPKDEDYGYITIEAFRSKKPVITCVDSGEPSILVKNEVNGFIVEPEPQKIAEKLNYLIHNPEKAAQMGENGYLSVKDITWENVVKDLLYDIRDTPNRNEIDKKLDLLITDMQPIEPATGGGRLRLKGLYSNLPANINSFYIGTYDWKGQKRREIRVSDSLLELDVPLDEEHFKLNEYLNRLLPGKTIIDTAFPLLAEASPEFSNLVRSEAKKADVIVHSHPWVYPLIKTEINLKNKLLIYDSHNCEALLRAKILGATPFARCLSRLAKFVERELCEDSNLIIACSEEDKMQFVKLYHIDPNKIKVVPNGVFSNDITPPDKATREMLKKSYNLKKKTAIFIGSDYPPNIEAAEYIINYISKKLQDIDFLILGGCGNKLNNDAINVKIFGEVSDEEKINLYSAADIAINPMLSGSGTNIKMFDFMAAGLPTISSPIGARGIENEGDFLITELANFPDVILEVFSDIDLYKRLSLRGRALIERKYEWNNISRKLGKLIYELYFQQSPFFSIIIPMFRGEGINILIEKLNRQDFKDFEVIVVDSGEERGDELRDLANFKLKYIHKINIGAVRARNIGIEYARGRIIAFTDDDCQPDADWLANAKYYFENNDIVGVEGYIYTDFDKINNPKYRIVTNKGFTGIGFMTANLFIKHDILNKIGKFDERFDKPHFREDTDLAWRALAYGSIPFADNVRVYHPPHLRKSEGESKEERDIFFINDAYLFQKHPKKYIDLMNAEENYLRNANFWMFFLKGCRSIKGDLPIRYILDDPIINSRIPKKYRNELEIMAGGSKF